MNLKYVWSRYVGYEVSSRGDARFSAFHAKMPDGRSIEQHYQCDVKGYDPGGTNWRLGKGKPPLDKFMDAQTQWLWYLNLWNTWARSHPDLMGELAHKAGQHENMLSDRFATSPINQAHALAIVLNAIKAYDDVIEGSLI